MRAEKTIKRLAGSRRSSLFTDVCKRYVRNPAAVIGGVILLIILLACLLANFIVPEEMVTAYDTQAKLQAPSAAHPFGTDNLGRDLFARVLYGARISVGIGVGATALSLVIGAAIASVCAMSKKADFVIMRVVDVITCVPTILLALVLLTVLGGSVFNMVLTLTIVSVPGFVLRIRAVVLGVVEQDYVKAARVSGTKSLKLVLKHILPNALDPIIVDATMTISSMMLSAAGLSFIGAPALGQFGSSLFRTQYMRNTAMGQHGQGYASQILQGQVGKIFLHTVQPLPENIAVYHRIKIGLSPALAQLLTKLAGGNIHHPLQLHQYRFRPAGLLQKRHMPAQHRLAVVFAAAKNAESTRLSNPPGMLPVLKGQEHICPHQ